MSLYILRQIIITSPLVPSVCQSHEHSVNHGIEKKKDVHLVKQDNTIFVA